MKRKYRLKKTAKNPFTALCGKRAFELFGGTNCLVTESVTTTGSMDIKKYAYFLYLDFKNQNKDIRVTSTCGVANCVKKDHLVAEYSPSKADLEYINTYKDVDGIEVLAHNMKVPVDLLTKFLAK